MQAETTLAPTEREQFEAWVRSEFPGVKLRRKGKFYNHPPTSEWWLIWQAARAQPAPQGPALVPLTDGQAKAALWAEHLRWMKAAGLDTEGMRPTADWLDHWLTYVRAIEAAHGITGAPNGKPT